MSKTVYRTVFQVEVFHDEPIDAYPDIDLLPEMHYLITDGPFIGNVEELSSDVVPAEDVETELVRIGNDGSFFDEADDDSGEFTCILTGEPGQNPDDCTTHSHEMTG